MMSSSLQANANWPIAWKTMYQQVVQNRIESELLLERIRQAAKAARLAKTPQPNTIQKPAIVIPPIAIETKKTSEPQSSVPVSETSPLVAPQGKVFEFKDIRPIGVGYSFDCAFAEDKNLHFRQTMQDSEFVDTKGEAYASFGVCDGHSEIKRKGNVFDPKSLVIMDSGKEVAEYVAQQIPIKLAKYIEAPFLSPKEVFTNVFADVDKGLAQDEKFKGGGSCVTMATVRENTLYTANAGDCRIILVRRTPVPFGVWSVKRLTKDHKPDDSGEANRITSIKGGFVAAGRVQGVLAVSRALGDLELRPYVSGVPDVTETRLRRDMYALVIACDGLWDVVDDSQAMSVLSRNSDKEAKEQAQILVDLAISKGSRDNITVMIVRFHTTEEAEDDDDEEEEEKDEKVDEEAEETKDQDTETIEPENQDHDKTGKDEKNENGGERDEGEEKAEGEGDEIQERVDESDDSEPIPLSVNDNNETIKTYLLHWIRQKAQQLDWNLDEDEDDKIIITFTGADVESRINVSIPAYNVSSSRVSELLFKDIPRSIYGRIDEIKMSKLTSFEEADLEAKEDDEEESGDEQAEGDETDAEAEGDAGEEEEDEQDDEDDEGDEGEDEEANVRQGEQKEAIKKLAIYVDVHKITDYHPENTTFAYDDNSILITLDTKQVPGQELEEFLDNQGVFSDEDVHVTVKTQYSLEDNVRSIIAEYAREHKLDKYKESETTIKVIESTDTKDETDTLDIRINLDTIPYELTHALNTKFNKYNVNVQKTGLNIYDIDAVLTRLRLGVRDARIDGPIDEKTKTVNIILNKPTFEVSKLVDALKEYAPEYTYNVVRGSSGKTKGKQGKKSNAKGSGSKDENVLEMEEDD